MLREQMPTPRGRQDDNVTRPKYLIRRWRGRAGRARGWIPWRRVSLRECAHAALRPVYTHRNKTTLCANEAAARGAASGLAQTAGVDDLLCVKHCPDLVAAQLLD